MLETNASTILEGLILNFFGFAIEIYQFSLRRALPVLSCSSRHLGEGTTREGAGRSEGETPGPGMLQRDLAGVSSCLFFQGTLFSFIKLTVIRFS